MLNNLDALREIHEKDQVCLSFTDPSPCVKLLSYADDM